MVFDGQKATLTVAEFTISRDPTIVDIMDLFNPRTQGDAAVIREMFTGSHLWIARLDGEPVAMAGLYTCEYGEAELWFSVNREAAPYVLRLLRKARLTISRLRYRRVVTVCRTVEGARMASILGFDFHEKNEIGEVWTWTHSQAAATTANKKRYADSANNLPS